MSDKLRVSKVAVEYHGMEYMIPVSTPAVTIPENNDELKVTWSFSTSEILRAIHQSSPLVPTFKDQTDAERWLDRYPTRT